MTIPIRKISAPLDHKRSALENFLKEAIFSPKSVGESLLGDKNNPPAQNLLQEKDPQINKYLYFLHTNLYNLSMDVQAAIDILDSKTSQVQQTASIKSIIKKTAQETALNQPETLPQDDIITELPEEPQEEPEVAKNPWGTLQQKQPTIKIEGNEFRPFEKLLNNLMIVVSKIHETLTKLSTVNKSVDQKLYGTLEDEVERLLGVNPQTLISIMQLIGRLQKNNNTLSLFDASTLSQHLKDFLQTTAESVLNQPGMIEDIEEKNIEPGSTEGTRFYNKEFWQDLLDGSPEKQAKFLSHFNMTPETLARSVQGLGIPVDNNPQRTFYLFLEYLHKHLPDNITEEFFVPRGKKPNELDYLMLDDDEITKFKSLSDITTPEFRDLYIYVKRNMLKDNYNYMENINSSSLSDDPKLYSFISKLAATNLASESGLINDPEKVSLANQIQMEAKECLAGPNPMGDAEKIFRVLYTFDRFNDSPAIKKSLYGLNQQYDDMYIGGLQNPWFNICNKVYLIMETCDRITQRIYSAMTYDYTSDWTDNEYLFENVLNNEAKIRSLIGQLNNNILRDQQKEELRQKQRAKEDRRSKYKSLRSNAAAIKSDVFQTPIDRQYEQEVYDTDESKRGSLYYMTRLLADIRIFLKMASIKIRDKSFNDKQRKVFNEASNKIASLIETINNIYSQPNGKQSAIDYLNQISSVLRTIRNRIFKGSTEAHEEMSGKQGFGPDFYTNIDRRGISGSKETPASEVIAANFSIQLYGNSILNSAPTSPVVKNQQPDQQNKLVAPTTEDFENIELAKKMFNFKIVTAQQGAVVPENDINESDDEGRDIKKLLDMFTVQVNKFVESIVSRKFLDSVQGFTVSESDIKDLIYSQDPEASDSSTDMAVVNTPVDEGSSYLGDKSRRVQEYLGEIVFANDSLDKYATDPVGMMLQNSTALQGLNKQFQEFKSTETEGKKTEQQKQKEIEDQKLEQSYKEEDSSNRTLYRVEMKDQEGVSEQTGMIFVEYYRYYLPGKKEPKVETSEKNVPFANMTPLSEPSAVPGGQDANGALYFIEYENPYITQQRIKGKKKKLPIDIPEEQKVISRYYYVPNKKSFNLSKIVKKAFNLRSIKNAN